MSVRSKPEEDESEQEDPNLKADWVNVILLTFIYLLQWIPNGLSLAIPFILQERKVTYADQAALSLSKYPYCLKLLWSPIVDSVYSKKLGRRKTWVIPTQFLLGVILFFLALNFDDWSGSEDGSRKPKPLFFAMALFACTLLGSTQNIAVDGWAITMLKKRNIGHQSTANNVGLAVGFYLAFIVFINLGTKEFGNFFRSAPQDRPLVPYSDFILFWSIVLLVSTVLLGLFKRERSLHATNKDGWRVAFGPHINLGPLKLVESGLSTNTLAILNSPGVPLIVLGSFIFGKYIGGPRSLLFYRSIYTARLFGSIWLTASVFIAPLVKNPLNHSFPTWYYCIILLINNLTVLLDHLSFTASGSFFSRVTDSRIGGIYLTLFNVVANAASGWPNTVSLWLVDALTIKTCTKSDLENADTCEAVFDGFLVEAILALLIGIIWLCWATKEMDQLEKLAPSAWKVEIAQRVVKEQVMLTSRDT